MGRVPVFVFPESLEFYLGARKTHKQLLTLYNPYEFPINFTVLSTSPYKFTVIDPEGIIAPRNCIDIIVRYSQPSISHCNGTDKFRITMEDRNSNKFLGKRDILIKYCSGEPENLNSDILSSDVFQPINVNNLAVKQDSILCNHPTHRDAKPNIIAICVGVSCIIALLLPTHVDVYSQSLLPSYLHISVNLKLVFSFVLGLVSMVVLKP